MPTQGTVTRAGVKLSSSDIVTTTTTTTSAIATVPVTTTTLVTEEEEESEETVVVEAASSAASTTTILEANNLTPDFSLGGSTGGSGGTQLTSHDLAALESIQFELDKLQQQQAGSNIAATTTTAIDSASSEHHHQQQPPVHIITAGSAAPSTVVYTSVAPSQSLTSNVGGGAHPAGLSLPVTLQNNQIIQAVSNTTSQTPKPIQSVVKRPLVSSSGQVVTKVIITKNPSGQLTPVATPPGSGQGLTMASLGQGVSLVPTQQQQQGQMPLTPTKTITISQSGIVTGTGTSPAKIITSLPVTPTKSGHSINKIALSPMKTPTKITMIPVSLAKSPQRIAPAPGGANIVTMVARTLSGTSTVSSSSSRPATITMSPSKVIIKHQQAQGQSLAKALSHHPTTGKQLTMPLNSNPNVQQIQVAGNKFQYVRLVTNPTSITSKPANIAPAPVQAKPIAPVTLSTGGQMKITLPVGQPTQMTKLATTSGVPTQRVILPASSQVPIRPSTSSTLINSLSSSSIRTTNANQLTQLPPGTTIISSGGGMQGVHGFALVPAQYLQLPSQIQPQQVKQDNSSYIPIASNDLSSSNNSSRHSVNGSVQTEALGQRPRKPCNCTKSQCLKLYCDCFANGEFCHNCNCTNCYNNLDHEEDRQRAIKACLDRNPLAFHPKIGSGKDGEGDRKHQKGCNCKRSGCLKNYCECYEAKIMCSSICKCVGCKNFEESPERKTLMHLAEAADVRVQQQTAARTKLSSQIQDLPCRPPPSATGERLPYTFVTTEVAEATCACLLAQAEECERTRQLESIQERLILEEFGRCLMQVIDSANKTKG